MTTRCQAIPITQAVAGSVLAEPVLDSRGQVLLGAYATLTDDLIRSLDSRGVSALCVECPKLVDAVDPQAQRERAAGRIAHLFRHSTRQGTINPLMPLVARYREGATP